MPFGMSSVPGVLLGAALRIAFSISEGVISGHSMGWGYSNPWMSDRSAFSGGGKNDWRRVSAFSLASRANPPPGFLSVGVHVGDTVCLFLAHLTSFHRPDLELDASSTRCRWVSRRLFRISPPFLFRACR